MSDETPQKELTREELYEKVWSTPGTKLAEELGISDVAITKRCKKLNVPRPSRGYWAKLAAGKKPRKLPLPPTPDEVFLKTAEQSVGNELSLPDGTGALHELAAAIIPAIKKAHLDSDKRAHLRSERTLPEVEISRAQAERVAQAFHVILQKVESLGIPFRKSQSSYDSGYFQKSHDRLYLKIEEQLIDKAPAARRSRYSGYGYGRREEKVPSGRLTFSLKTERYGSKDATEFAESEKLPLDKVLARVVNEIRRHYVAAQKRRKAEAIQREKDRIESEIRHKKYLEERAIQEAEEAKKNHAKALKKTAKKRQDDFLKASEWWRMFESANAFIAACEHRWKESQSGELTPEQVEWLTWARNISNDLSPFALGYPEPSKDGPFNPEEVPFGGPYPEIRDFPRPPTMPKIPPPVVQQSGYGYSSTPTTAPTLYPFWLRHQGR
jgi:hypothetical protein